jgi:hypothetical protein
MRELAYQPEPKDDDARRLAGCDADVVEVDHGGL